MTSHRKGLALLIALFVPPLFSAPASATPLKLSEIYDLGKYVECVSGCTVPAAGAPYESHVVYQECLAACGHAPRIWEKNGIWPVDKTDHELALLEYQHVLDKDQHYICYGDVDETIVIPGALCSGAVCEQMAECTVADCAAPSDAALSCTDQGPAGAVCWWPDTKRPAACPDVVCQAKPVHSFQECADADGDGLPAWLEKFKGTNPNAADPLCSSAKPCGFDKSCAYDPTLGAGTCVPRKCQGTCTAFHLDMVAQDDQEVIVHVFYDFTPIPARALDLYITYDQAALTLEDSRRLAPLVLQDKQLATTHLADGTLRLSVYDTNGTHPIPTGPIVELVFRRHTQESSIIAFSTSDILQAKAVAPLQGNGATQNQLTLDANWGAAVKVPSLAEVTTHLRLLYSFDESAPALTYANVPSAEELCATMATCANEEDEVAKARMLGRLKSLQSGTAVGGEPIKGLSGNALYMDGASSHLRLPVYYREPLAPGAQSFSMSTWFYGEGNSANELKKSPQILYSHLAFSERTRLGLVLKPQGGDLLTLALFSGDMLGKAPPPVEVKVATGISKRAWHHAGFTLDTTTGKVDLYFDGKKTGQAVIAQPPTAVACPQFFGATNVLLHEEGDVLGGKPPERVYVAREKSNRYSIHRMDPSGLGDTQIIGDPEFSFKDPDYSTLVDKLVYSSNLSGDFEIWMANGDGTGQQQLTVGFGDSYLGVSARHPRWAPDASAIVFDSNAFDTFAGDNDYARVRHLYYIGYDAAKNTVAIQAPGAGTLSQLDYSTLVANQTIGSYRPTDAAKDRHHSNAQWLTGRNPVTGGRGELLMATAAPGFEGARISRLTIAAQVQSSSAEEVQGLTDGNNDGEEIRLIASRHASKPAVPQPIVTERLLYERSFAVFETNDEFTYSLDQPSPDADAKVTVAHVQPAYDAMCWDTNFNALQDTDEDRDGNGKWDVADCNPHEVRNLYLEFDPLKYIPVIEDDNGQAKTPGALLGSLGKTLKLHIEYPAGRAFVRVEVLSPLDITPLGVGELATIEFKSVPDTLSTIPFGMWKRQGVGQLMVKDLLSTAEPVAFETANLFESVDDAEFSPDGERLLLLAISKSRPVLLRTESADSAEGAKPILEDAEQLRGFDWVRQDSFMACNWVGGYLHPQSKTMMWGLRGGMDDLKVYSGLRDPDAIRSEAERGHAYLDAAGLGGQVQSKLPSCGTDHLECPPYHLCVDSQCQMVACNPDDPYTCLEHGGRCKVRPLNVEQEFKGPSGEDLFTWVCAADCNVDKQCFEQECKNGPCRFCDQTSQTCIECRDATLALGDLSIATVEGCPDQKSFRCEAGTCVTECYAFTDEESVYLCDQAVEYCQAGRCVLHDWDWWDLAPASFAGGVRSRQKVAPDPGNGWNGYTMSVDQRIPILITAYGVGDYGAAPQLIVEARGGPFYGGDWHRIGEAVVTATTMTKAKGDPIVLSSPHVFDALRLRMVTTPYDNLTNGGTGLGSKDVDFCLADLKATSKTADPALCNRRAQGSRFGLGYPADIPWHEVIEACAEHGGSGCPPTQNGEHDYLYGGQPAAVLLDVQVDGASVMNAITQDLVCAYGGYGAGALTPLENGAPKKVFYGDISTEISPQKDALCAADPAACTSPGPAGLVEFPHETKGYALFNCNVFDPAKGQETAGVTFGGIVQVKPWPASAGSIVKDTGDVCQVSLDAMLTTPCYEWQDDLVSLDPYAGVVTSGFSTPYGTLDLGTFRSFGHDEGAEVIPLPKYPLTVKVTGYTGTGLEIGCNGGLISVPSGAETTILDCGKVKKGKKIKVSIAKQPTIKDQTCTVLKDASVAHMAEPGAEVQVFCGVLHKVGGTVAGFKGGTLKLMGNLSLTGAGISAKEILSVSTDGPFTFETQLPKQGSYDVVVKSVSQGQVCSVANAKGSMSGGAVTNIKVTCKDAVPHGLSVVVNGLEGSGLALLEKKGGASLKPTSNGTHFFSAQLYAGAAYEIVVTDQPKNPPQLCVLTGSGSGIMPDASQVGAQVSCSKLATYPIGVVVTGLSEGSVTLTLNGKEQLEIASGGGAKEVKFLTQLTMGTLWSVELTDQPLTPNLQCSLVDSTASGIIDGPLTSPVLVTCIPGAGGDTYYYVGGTVKGLAGAGLELDLGYGVQKLKVAENGPFKFPKQLPDGASLNLAVTQQPKGPTQLCTIAIPTKKVNLADVLDIVVTCVDAVPITVEVHSTISNGAKIQALLMSTGKDAKLIARGPDSAMLENDKAVFMLEDLTSDPQEIHVPPGDYIIFVMVNHNGSFGMDGKPNMNAGDYGSFLKFTANANSPPTLSFGPGDLKVMSAAMAVIPDMGNWKKGDLTCWWTPFGSGELAIPPAPHAPVVTKSSHVCFDVTTDGPVACFDDDNPLKAHTDVNGAAPMLGLYEVTCWIDVDNSGTVTPKDYTGFKSGVLQKEDAPLTATTTMKMAVIP